MIDRAVNSHVGSKASPTIKDRARLMAIEAVERYSPQPGKSLNAFVTSTLQGLKRDAPQISQPFVAASDARRMHMKIYSIGQNLINDLGREPSDEELQDATGLSMKQLVKARRRMRAQVPLSMWEAKFDDEDGEGSDVATQSHTPYDDWQDAVYHGLGQIDRLIMQYRSGYRSSPVLSGVEIARKLNITPATVSARASAIQSRLDEFHA